MTRFLLYLLPALIDMALGSVVMFVAPVRMAAVEGSTASAVANLLTVWAAAYMIACRALGRVVRPTNAAALATVGGLGVAACAVLFWCIPAPAAMYWLMIPQGVALAMFFVPFQVFMKTVEGPHAGDLVRSTALYTASWSAGLACGPFLAGWLITFWDWRACMAMNIVIGLTAAGGIACIRRRMEKTPPPEPADSDDSNRYAHMPDLAPLAWIGSGAGFIAVSVIRALTPKMAAAVHIADSNLGMILASLALAHSATALTFLGSRRWMYRGGAVASFGLCGLLGLVLFALGRGPAALYAAAVCFGVYSGAFCFYFVFHALVHPDRSAKYVAVNETVVGACAIIGPFAGGLIADRFGFAWPYLAAAGLVAAALAVQGAVHRRHAAAVAALK